MELSVKETWNRLLDQARGRLPEPTIRSWLEPVEPIGLENGTLVLAAPDEFAADWNKSNYAGLLSDLSTQVVGRRLEMSFRVMEERSRRPQMDFFVATPATAGGAAPAKAPAWSMPLNERYTFGTFVIGKSNELAAAAAHAVAEAPGKAYNPLFIYGATGLGKTHLMQAIAHAVLQRSPQTRAVYMSGEQFTNEVDRAHPRPEDAGVPASLPQRSRSAAARRRALPGAEGSHPGGVLPHLQRALRGRQADRPHQRPLAQGDRRASKCGWCPGSTGAWWPTSASPISSTASAILRKKAEQDHLELTIPDDVLQFIAEHVRSSVRELEGCIIKLLLFASLKHREITIELAREALSDKIRPAEEAGADAANRRGGASIDRVQEVVARRWGVTPEGLRSKARTKRLTVPRQVAMYLARDLLGMQLVEIGQAFGGRDHSTVIHSLDKVSRQLARDHSFRDRVTQARTELSAV